MTGFRAPTHVDIADGARHRLGATLRSLGAARALLVLDPGLASTPWPAEIADALADAGVAVETFDALEPNPRTASAEAAAARAREAGAQAVIGLGGGSALDAAKAAAMLATNPGHARDYTGVDRFDAPPLPLIAIPTTCGTGSEVTWVAVLSDPEAGTKISVKGERMFPVQALVDPELLVSLPPTLVAFTGVDALTHALEAITCRRANPISDALAAEAVRALFAFLPRAVADIAGDAEARFATMRAATLAGLAFGNADVASVHCLSESLGGLFDVPHGLTNAVLLAPMLRYNRPYIDRRLAGLLPLVAPPAALTAVPEDEKARADRFLAGLDTLLEDLEIPPFAALGVPAETDLERIASLAAANGSNPSNARPMAAEDYLRVLRAL